MHSFDFTNFTTFFLPGHFRIEYYVIFCVLQDLLEISFFQLHYLDLCSIFQLEYFFQFHEKKNWSTLIPTFLLSDYTM